MDVLLWRKVDSMNPMIKMIPDAVNSLSRPQARVRCQAVDHEWRMVQARVGQGYLWACVKCRNFVQAPAKRKWTFLKPSAVKR